MLCVQEASHKPTPVAIWYASAHAQLQHIRGGAPQHKGGERERESVSMLSLRGSRSQKCLLKQMGIKDL